MAARTFVARPVAPEDIRPGAYIAILHVLLEHRNCDYDPALGNEPVLRARFLPIDQTGPLRVEGVCLPFVQVRTGGAKVLTLDLRRLEVALLPGGYATKAFARQKRITDFFDLI